MARKAIGKIQKVKKDELDGEGKYVKWNINMECALADVLREQRNMGNKGDSGWRSIVFTTAAETLSSKFNTAISANNVKNKIKVWKRTYAVVSDILSQSDFHWNGGRCMIQVDDEHAWNEYARLRRYAASYRYKNIPNWSDIADLFGDDRATEEGVDDVMSSEEGSEMAKKYQLVIPEDQVKPAKVLSLCNPRRCLPRIRKKLKGVQMEKFRESCFGKLLTLDELQWSFPTVHGLIVRKVTGRGLNEDGVSFLVGGKVIQFTLKDFCLITGLLCGEVPKLDSANEEPSRLQKTYFKEDKSVSIADLEEAFKTCTVEDDMLKLGLVYFAETVLLGRERSTQIDMMHLKLVDDIEQWNQYPWGTVSFARTHDSLYRALKYVYKKTKGNAQIEEGTKGKAKGEERGKNIQGSESDEELDAFDEDEEDEEAQESDEGNNVTKEKKTKNGGLNSKYKLRGFALAFQAWAFECFPGLQKLNHVVMNRIPNLPRILHWKLVKGGLFHTLQSHIYQSDRAQVLSLEPTEEEKNAGLWPWGTTESPRITDAGGNHGVGSDCDVGIPDLSMPQGYDFGAWHQHLQKLTDYVTNLGKENHVLKKRVAYLDRKNQELEEVVREKLDKFDIEIKEGFSELNQKIRAAYASHGDSTHPSNEPDDDPQDHPTLESQMLVVFTDAGGNHDVGSDDNVGIPDLSMPQGYDIGAWHQHLQKLTDYVTNLGHENHVLKPRVAYLERKNQEVEKALRVKLDKFDSKIKEGFSELNHQITAAYASNGASMVNDTVITTTTPLPAVDVVVPPELMTVQSCKQLCKRLTAQLKPVVKCLVHETEKPGARKSGMKVPDGGDHYEAPIHIVEEDSPVDQTPEDKGVKEKRMAAPLRPPYTVTLKKRRKVAEGEGTTKAMYRYNPLSAVPHDDVLIMVDFVKSWTVTSMESLYLDNYEVTLSFFLKLFNMDGWLLDEHMNIALYLFRKRQADNPDLFSTDWTTTDCYFQKLLEGALSETFPSKVEGKAGEAEEQDGVELPYNLKRLQEYILGNRPPAHTLPWSQVLKVYVPYNLGGEHWVAAEVDLVKQSIVLYDSLYDNTASKHISKLCEPLTSALPRVLKHLDFYKTYEVGHDCGASTSKVYFPWKVTRPYSKIPQQTDESSCGVFAIRFFDFLVSKFDVASCCTQDDIPMFRLKLAAETLRMQAYS